MQRGVGPHPCISLSSLTFALPLNCLSAPPLPPQQCDEALGRSHGFRTRAYHGSANNHRLSSWSRQRWEGVLAETDVLVMTPDVLLHTLSHGVFRVRRTYSAAAWLGPCCDTLKSVICTAADGSRFDLNVLMRVQ
jgi:hypothetical protein